MKLIRHSATLLAFLFAAHVGNAVVTLFDDAFADGVSTNQDIAGNSMAVFKGRDATTRTDSVGQVDFTLGSTSSEGFWGFFTDPGSPVTLNEGEKLTFTLKFKLLGFPIDTGKDIRFGVVNSMGTRVMNDLNGGHNHATFADDPGYSLQFYTSGTGSPFIIGHRANFVNNMFNSMGDWTVIPGTGATSRQTLANNTEYTLSYSITHVDATHTKIRAQVTGGTLGANFYWEGTETATPVTAFDSFGLRVPNKNFSTDIIFTGVKVELTAAPPKIDVQPEPTNALIKVGGGITLEVAASGSGLSYRWYRDTTALDDEAGHIAGATTSTLTFSNLVLGDSGSYTVVVTNDTASVTSDAVVLGVTTEDVPLHPVVDDDPDDATCLAGTDATFTVTATGVGMTYQWYKDGIIIPALQNASAVTDTLVVPAVDAGDMGQYRVTVINSGGSVKSAPATLYVTSPMAPASYAPAGGSTGLCIDQPLTVTFDQAPVLGSTGRIRVYNAADNSLVDTIDLGMTSHTKSFGGTTLAYRPVTITGSSARIELHAPLAYGTTYYLTMEQGTFRDDTGALFAGLTDPAAWGFSTKGSGPAAGSAALTVAADGTGDFCGPQAAIDFVPAGNTQRVTITVMNGTYWTMLRVPSTKPFITLQGQSRAGAVICYPNNDVLNSGTANRPMFRVDGNDFVLQNISLVNTTPKGGSQAEAFATSNTLQRCTISRVNFSSYQDTLLTNGQVFFTDCQVAGDVDFMWGTGVSYYQRCEIKSLNDGYLCQVRNAAGSYGQIYVDCRLTRAPSVPDASCVFNRIDPAAYPYCEAVWINCAMDAHIKPVGWQLDGGATTAPNAHFWEYQSTNLNGVPVNISARHASSRQMTDGEAATYRNVPAIVGFTPAVVPVIDASPADRTVNRGESTTFTVDATLGYPTAACQWKKDGVDIPGAIGTSHTITSPTAGDNGSYTCVITNTSGEVTSTAAALTVNDAAGDYFISHGLDPNSPEGALDVDADGDGISNMFEYALGGDPTSGDGSILKGASDTTSGGLPAIAYEYDHNTAAAGVTVEVQYSTDLTGWTTAVDGVGGVTITTAPVRPGVEHVTVVIPTSGASLYVRLQITY